MPSDTSREIIRAVARSQGAERATKSPKDDIRSAPEEIKLLNLSQEEQFFDARTSSTSVSSGKWSERLLQVVNPIDLFLDFVQLDADSGTSRRDMFEGSSSREIESFLEFLDQGIRIERVEKVDIPRRAAER